MAFIIVASQSGGIVSWDGFKKQNSGLQLPVALGTVLLTLFYNQ